jgi:hypothetical protein
MWGFLPIVALRLRVNDQLTSEKSGWLNGRIP